MNTERMEEFLAQVSAAHSAEYPVFIVDGPSSHVAKALVVPANIVRYRLPPYSPQRNPPEHLWDGVRKKEFPNRVFENREGVRSQWEAGLPRWSQDEARSQGICAWPWIVNLNLNAT